MSKLASPASICLNDPSSQTQNDQRQFIENAAEDCLDVQIELFDHVEKHLKRLPWASLPDEIQNVLSTKIVSPKHRFVVDKSRIEGFHEAPGPSLHSAQFFLYPRSLTDTSKQQTVPFITASCSLFQASNKMVSLLTTNQSSTKGKASSFLSSDAANNTPCIDREPLRLQANEYAQAPADVLPSNIARRSTRLANTTSDKATAKRKAVVPPSPGLPEISKKLRLSQAESDDGSVYDAIDDEPAVLDDTELLDPVDDE
ncbi:hypothetical protein EDB82DRAFT_524156 [Fusarium venenatum]|uniref:uncharacterized protein n=1 Tax=Fusarium venenatum TaxID=56646 RepID=UPI001D227429|nr:hypothetical protein EDB82DRAFT_524156 [Fusarium venenatum]